MVAKFLLLIVASSVVVAAKVTIPPDLQEYINDIHGECLKKIGITEDDHTTYNLEHKDPKMMCYMNCLMLISKWMTSDGKIQYDFIIENAHPEVAHVLVPAVNKCRDISDGTEECEKAYNFNLCLFHADPENWFLV